MRGVALRRWTFFLVATGLFFRFVYRRSISGLFIRAMMARMEEEG